MMTSCNMHNSLRLTHGAEVETFAHLSHQAN